MKPLLTLIFRDAWYHRTRMSLAVLTTVAMSCMIVWLIGSLDLMMVRFEQDAENYLGHYHVAMVPVETPTPSRGAGRDGSGGVPQPVVEELRNDALVVNVTPARRIRCLMGKMEHEHDEHAAIRRQRSGTGIPIPHPALIAVDTDESPFELTAGRWFSDRAETLEGVMGSAAAASLREWGGDETGPVQVGDTVICRVGTNDFKVNIVGLFEQNLASGERGSTGPVTGAVYVSAKTAETIRPDAQQKSPRIDFAYIRLREGANTGAFKDLWTRHLRERGVAMDFLDPDDIQRQLDRVRAQNAAGLMGGAASMGATLFFTSLASVLIVFTALNMGVNERTRVFAMLRVLGMPRRGVAALVFGESMVLCLSGWIGGIVAGWGVLQWSVWLQPEFYGTGKTVAPGLQAVATAGLAALIGCVAAAILPAWRATRISPLEGMNRGFLATPRKKRISLLVLPVAIAVPLLTLNPIFMYCEGIPGEAATRQFLYVFVGLPTQIVACLLLVPPAIVSVEIVFGPLVANILKLPKELLATQLSDNLWRTLGTTVSLSVGLGMYVFLEISGYSMLVPYTQSPTLPHTLVTFLPDGFSGEEIETVRNVPGIDAQRFLPIALEQSRFSRRQSERFLARGLAAMQNSAVVFGIDVEEAFEKRGDCSRPLIEVEFREGTLESALKKLKTGRRYCLVPDSFAFRTGLHIGDTLELVLPPDAGGASRGTADSGEAILEYEICGVVSIHGWLWMNKISGVRTRGYRSGAMLLAPYESVKNDYGISEIAHFWFDRTRDASGRAIVSDAELEESLQNLADAHFANENSATPRDVPQQNASEPPRRGVSRPMVKVSSREYLTERVGARADEVIQAAAKIPLILLAISSFAMMGTIAASVRVRRYEFGVLRSLGVTRMELTRLILAEALLISLAVIVLSVGFGLIGAWCFIGLMRYVSAFGGFVSPLTIPVSRLSTGFLITLVLCVLAAIGPAASAGRTDPARLLRER